MNSLRRRLRAAGRALLLLVLTTYCMAFWWLGAAIARRSVGAAWRWRCLWFGTWARWAIRAMGVRLAVSGQAPEAPFVLVCNHLGYLDVAVMASAFDATFVAKTEVARWPVLGRLCRWMGTLFLDRGRRRDLPAALAAIERELAAGRGVVVFPEGTSSDGGRVLPFHPPLLAAAQQAGLPVSWAALTYRTPPGDAAAGDVVCWWGEMPFLSHFGTLLSLPYIEARLHFGEQAIAGPDRKRLAESLRRAIACEAGLERMPAASL